jgi:membrane protease YdiL (CAAX protease family)
MSGGRYFLRQVVILWAAGLVGVVAVMPFLFLTQASMLDKAAAKGVTTPLLVALILLQSAVMLAIAVPVGLWAASRLDLQAPLSHALATGENLRTVTRPFLGIALLAGGVTGIVLLLLSAFVFGPSMPAEFIALRRSITWQGLPAALCGGVTEELLFRLFLLSLLALGLRRVLAPTSTGLPAAPFWVANCFAALLFGLGHIPNRSPGVPLTPTVWAYAILLNGICGTVFGWLYWRKGLEAAMLAHFTVDIVLHGIGPVLDRINTG